jgi:galactokinase
VEASVTVDPAELYRGFWERYGSRPRLFSAPGRVNLIGEHTDYNDGWVLPIAIRARTWVAAAARADFVVRAYSRQLSDEYQFSLEQPSGRCRGRWVDYVEGMARVLVARGVLLTGADLLIDSDVPLGAGLSSSAALELSVGQALLSLADQNWPPVDLARAGQAAEHEFAGVACGPMDQLISALARDGHALLIDCRSRQCTHVRLPEMDARFVVCDTRVRHQLAASGYNWRREECRQAVRYLRASGSEIDSLRDLRIEDLERALKLLPSPLDKRARHVVQENARACAGVKAMRRSHVQGLGRLMTGSHSSLRDDFEVSCAELDFVVETALGLNGVLGARMTGGGFGGSAILLVQNEAVKRACATLHESFAQRFGTQPELYVTDAGDGMRIEPGAAEEQNPGFSPDVVVADS